MTVYPSRAYRRRRWPMRAAAALAVVLLAVAAVELGTVAARMHHDRAVLDAGQDALARQWDLTQAIAAAPDAPGVPPAGGPIGRMFIPRLGVPDGWVLVEGVTEQALKGGPGHFPDSADVGQRGNFAVAGHRENGMFADLDDTREHDSIVIETRQRFYVYTVVSVQVTLPTDFAQLAPTPPGMKPGRLLTLMTCWPRFDNTHRLWVHAVLVRTTPADQPPPELETS